MASHHFYMKLLNFMLNSNLIFVGDGLKELYVSKWLVHHAISTRINRKLDSSHV